MDANTDELYAMAQDLQSDEYDLNDWEQNFVVSMESMIEKGHSLTENQEAKLREIHATHVGA